ncbi:hypothetical protein LP416_11395 [Polaromonas sp. P2-4]|nr:hypothetical protein LP416_11395 [Polaromonas sp. P2-4]
MKQKLTWIREGQRPRLKPPIFPEDPKRSYYAKQWVTDDDLFDNWLVCGC